MKRKARQLRQFLEMIRLSPGNNRSRTSTVWTATRRVTSLNPIYIKVYIRTMER